MKIAIVIYELILFFFLVLSITFHSEDWYQYIESDYADDRAVRDCGDK